MMYYLDAISKVVILDEENMRKLYTNHNSLVLNFVYENDKELFDDYNLDLIVEPLKAQLYNHKYIDAYTERLTDTDKLELLKQTYPRTRSEVNINWEDITILFGEDNWNGIVKHYVYLNAYTMLDDMLQEEMLEIFKNYEQERINKVARNIAINKIKRNQLYYCGLAQRLNMRDCGIELAVA